MSWTPTLPTRSASRPIPRTTGVRIGPRAATGSPSPAIVTRPPDVYVMDEDGANLKRLTTHRAGDWCPDWSPNGDRIVFESKRDGTNDIYMMDADGGDPKRLTGTVADDRGPKWSPNGKRIAFTRSQADDAAEDRMLRWSQDGKDILFSSERRLTDGAEEIYAMKADGSCEQRLTAFNEPTVATSSPDTGFDAPNQGTTASASSCPR